MDLLEHYGSYFIISSHGVHGGKTVESIRLKMRMAIRLLFCSAHNKQVGLRYLCFDWPCQRRSLNDPERIPELHLWAVSPKMFQLGMSTKLPHYHEHLPPEKKKACSASTTCDSDTSVISITNTGKSTFCATCCQRRVD